MVWLAGAVNMGGVSSTVTVNVWLVDMPDEFVAVQVTVLAPMWKVEPEAGPQVTGSVPSLKSFAVRVTYVATAPAGLVAGMVWLAGAVKVGGVSTTVIVK